MLCTVKTKSTCQADPLPAEQIAARRERWSPSEMKEIEIQVTTPDTWTKAETQLLAAMLILQKQQIHATAELVRAAVSSDALPEKELQESTLAFLQAVSADLLQKVFEPGVKIELIPDP